MRYYITESQLICTKVLNNNKYYIYILTLLSKETVGIADKHMKLKTLFITKNNTIEFYNFESIRIDKYYKGLLDEDVAKIKYSDRDVKGTILLERDNDSLMTSFRQNFYGAFNKEDIFEFTLQNN
jgi:hypothetical protein